jgi:hypothetical protein
MTVMIYIVLIKVTTVWMIIGTRINVFEDSGLHGCDTLLLGV